MHIPASVSDYQERARRRLPSFLFGFLNGGSCAEDTLAENVSAWGRHRLRQFVLRDVSQIEIGTDYFGQPASMPLALAPVGLGGLMRRRGEIQAARAAEAAGVPFTLCTPALCSIEEVRSATKAPFWFQLYMLRDRGIVRELLARARAAQCSALVFTVDLARVGVRRSDIRHGMTAKATPRITAARAGDVLRHPRWLNDVMLRGGPHVFGNLAAYVPKARNLEAFKAWVDARFDPGITWRDIEWLRTVWDGPILLKGILEAEDAAMAASIGIEGIVVSNHGGRQLDSTEATADALPRIADALAGRVRILVDGGIRNGHDMIKAVALGADGVMIGRPWAWALAADGQAGVANMLAMLGNEMRNSLGLMGLSRLRDVGRHSLLPATVPFNGK